MTNKFKVYQINCKVYLLHNVPLPYVLQEIAHLTDSALGKDEAMCALHKENRFKNYVLSGFREIEKDKLYKEGKLYSFSVRCAEESFANYLVETLPKTDTEKMKGLTAEYKIIPQMFITKLYNITPSIAVTNTGDGYWKGKISLEKYENLLFSNAVKKYNNLTNEKINEDFRLYDCIRFQNRTPIGTYKYKGITLLGDKLELQISDNERAQCIAYMLLATGTLNLNARGYGYTNYISE